MSNKLTKKQIIKRLSESHPNYVILEPGETYSKDLWKFQCNVCDDVFERTPFSLYPSVKCCNCIRNKHYTYDTLCEKLDKLTEKLGLTYTKDFEFKGKMSRVFLKCNSCEYEWDTVYNTLCYVKGCLSCDSKRTKYDNDVFSSRASKLHNNKYDYSNVQYVDKKVKVRIICPEHGEFLQSAGDHLQGKGCIRCSGNWKYDFEDFLEKAIITHGQEYSYVKDSFKGMSEKVTIICKEHGEFEQNASNHLGGNRCPICYPRGYNPRVEGYFYIQRIKNKDSVYIKYGITNRDPNIRMKRQFKAGSKFKHSIISFYLFPDGEIPMRIESTVKQKVPSGVVPKELLPDGFTETCDIKYLNDILNIVNEVSSS